MLIIFLIPDNDNNISYRIILVACVHIEDSAAPFLCLLYGLLVRKVLELWAVEVAPHSDSNLSLVAAVPGVKPSQVRRHHAQLS